jgi:hypothetical protein
MTDATATAAAAEIIEIAHSLEDWALEIDGDADEALSLIAIRGAVLETLEDIKAVWAAYADGYTVPRDALRVAHSILRGLDAHTAA